MAVVEAEGTGGVRRKRRGGGAIVVGPGGRAPAPSGGYTAPAAGGGSGSSRAGAGAKAGAGATTGAGGSGGGGGSAYSKAQSKAADRYRRQALNLEAQARALKHALNVDLKMGLLQQLGDITQVTKQQNQIVREGFRERLDSLEGAAEDNVKAAQGQTSLNQQNQVRERNSAITEAMSQGAGESDVLQSMMMSLRNWSANQTEIERGYFDTLRSIQSGQTDLEVDTKTALVNNKIQANADRETLWTNFYNQRSEISTQLGNVRGQQADYYAMANEMGSGGGKKSGGKKSGGAKAESGKGGGGRPRRDGGGSGGGGVARATAQAASAFMQASKELGKSWDNPGVSDRIMRWEGGPEIESTRTQAPGLQGVKTVELGKKPEGATLRKW